MATETPLPTREKDASALHLSQHRKDEYDISLLDLLIALAGRKWLILKVTAVFAALSVVVALLLPKKYTATVLLLPPQQNSSMGAQLSSQLGAFAALAGGGGSSLLKNPNDMYVAMLRSNTVEDAMIEKFGLSKEYNTKYLSDTRKAFERHAKVDGSGKDGLIRISIEDGDPNRAAALANGYVDQFRNLSEHLAITEAAQRRMFFQEQMQQTKDNLADAEESLAKTEKNTGLIQLDSQARALIESAASLQGQITAKEVQIRGIETYATGENAQLIQARQELDGLRAQLASLEGSEKMPGSGIIPGKGQMTAAGVEYVRRLRDVKYYEAIFDILARQFEIAKLDEAKQGALIQVVDPAIPPDKRSWPKRGFIILISTGIGFLIGAVIALLSAGFERLKENPQAASQLMILSEALSLKTRGTPRA